MNNFLKIPFGLGLGIAVIATATFAASHSDKISNKTVAARHAQMQIVSYSTGVLGAMAKGEVEFDADMANSAATNLNAMAKLDAASLWVPGTEQGAVDGSRAKAEIWSDAAGFADKFAALEKASAELMGVADVDALKAGMGAVGGACKACHESYRGPKN
ncbi:MAG: c-type cytochrome [Sulfitobacter sp.]